MVAARCTREELGRSFADDLSQVVTAVTLDHDVHILGGSKTRPDADDERGFVCVCRRSRLRHNRVDHDMGTNPFDALPFRIDENRDALLLPETGESVDILQEGGPNAFNLSTSFIDGFGEGNRPSHGNRFFCVRHEYFREAGAVKPVGDATCHFTGAFDDYGQVSHSWTTRALDSPSQFFPVGIEGMIFYALITTNLIQPDDFNCRKLAPSPIYFSASALFVTTLPEMISMP